MGLEKSLFVAGLLWVYGLAAWVLISLWAAGLFAVSALRVSPRIGRWNVLACAAQLVAVVATPAVVLFSLGVA